MAWDCDDPSSFETNEITVASLDPSDRVDWFPDGSWWRPTSNGDIITVSDFGVDPGKRGYVNVQGLNDGSDRGFDVRIDGGPWVHVNSNEGATGSLVTLLTLPDVLNIAWIGDDYGTGWESGLAPGLHDLELRAAFAVNPTNITKFEFNQYDDCAPGTWSFNVRWPR